MVHNPGDEDREPPGRGAMAVSALDHYTIMTADLDASVTFYTEILGLADGPRPAFTRRAPGSIAASARSST